eukprot:COSAG06_NODE_2156_length_7453_cov_4.416372_4_plen_65_part_00
MTWLYLDLTFLASLEARVQACVNIKITRIGSICQRQLCHQLRAVLPQVLRAGLQSINQSASRQV